MTEDVDLFSLNRKTRQTDADMRRELEAFLRYWKEANGGDTNTPVKAADYMRWSGRRYHYSTLTRHYGDWEIICKEFNLNPWKIHEYEDEKIINLVLDLWRWRGQRPVITDLQKYNKEHGTNLHAATISNKWGKWTVFLKLISQLGRNQITVEDVIAAKLVKNPREPISARLRSEVLRRDNYTCVDCGASPRKNSSVNLHIHHVTPVSQGGKSVIDNLVTNCDKCNLGKSDKIGSE